ncbi:SMP-30/gluconolactonase/LRE family protein [Paracoccus sp. Z330]|uniref:SMP-30/gluconolactonase/LRE family protein n=1 Tax=Paracoccus onchidii TaxID=3017813 RepID=A0ABT4ZG28_9RHOB|nr:SMP-30/gluconolactonase/LRE family protein [Paracoccus onchidii]MDB6178331.1 SMP-30/gluconolactonase/LRE family protein [Paracoccus onchidii]
MTARVFSDTRCQLGEGPLWHPLREELFWFDILGQCLMARPMQGEERRWQFDEYVSAAGWVDHQSLLLASETGLYRFDIASGQRSLIVPLEADNPVTRSNDGRADPWRGFWIGTMGKNAEPEAGAIYRFYEGELRKLVSGMTITNAICFAPDKTQAYYVDTAKGQVMRQPLNRENGWPDGAPSVYLDFSGQDVGADGAVTDRDGCFCVALWGGARVECYDGQGILRNRVELPASQATCPAFGGEGMKTMFVTSAAKDDEMQGAGMTFAVETTVAGNPEPRVRL